MVGIAASLDGVLEAAGGRSGARRTKTTLDLYLLSPWLADDTEAWTILEESVTCTPRFRVDGERWLAVHRAALETFALVALTPEEHRPTERRVKPGDLVVLGAREVPRVLVVLDVREGRDGGRVVMLAPDAEDGKRSFLASRVVTLPWDIGTVVVGS